MFSLTLILAERFRIQRDRISPSGSILAIMMDDGCKTKLNRNTDSVD
jgi:hypothetical protein